ncbi:hypothetical protein [Siccibacter colletis]|uniref:DUF1496 domain-containing protein n=1 Tax=Siccibacter colletis TaxID=1505757 RepID=A0ABY6JCP7_9ENTR|nr:hypothetical protein [Siccibacter colletis]UYU30369.1 hypothetical protein KFZ77_10695 [Siccibacter colletis]
MNKTLLLLLSFTCGAALAADTGSATIKAQSQSLIRQAGHPCNLVNGVYPAAFGGSVTVVCDDDLRYVIKNKGGNFVVEEAE